MLAAGASIETRSGTMDLRRIIPTDITVSAIVHLSLMASLLLFMSASVRNPRSMHGEPARRVGQGGERSTEGGRRRLKGSRKNLIEMIKTYGYDVQVVRHVLED